VTSCRTGALSAPLNDASSSEPFVDAHSRPVAALAAGSPPDERPYFLTHSDEMPGEGYAVMRDALRRTGKVGLGQLTVAGREWLVAVAPLQNRGPNVAPQDDRVVTWRDGGLVLVPARTPRRGQGAGCLADVG
jgi:hypothetical protein